MATRPDLIDLMPYWLQREDATGDYAKFMDILQQALDHYREIYDRYKEIGNVDLVDSEAVVNAYLDGLGNPFDVSQMTLSQKRRLVMQLVDIYRQFGTDDSIKTVVAVFTTRVVIDIVQGTVQGWILGEHVLGDGIHPTDWNAPTDFAVIYPTDEFLVYSFRLVLDGTPTSAEEQTIAKLMDIVKPAYMHYLGIQTPTTPVPFYAHVELGISELDYTFDLH